RDVTGNAQAQALGEGFSVDDCCGHCAPPKLCRAAIENSAALVHGLGAIQGPNKVKTAWHFCRTAFTWDAARCAVEGLGDKQRTVSWLTGAWVVCFADE